MSNKFEAYYYGDEDEESIRVKARESEKAPKIMFARWGNMNPKRNKEKEKRFGLSNGTERSFHTSPEHVGIYAFIWPYIEPFLALWNDKIMKKTNKSDEYGDPISKPIPIKKFYHHGDIWCHFVEEAKKLGVGKEYKGSWVKVDTKDLPILLGKVMARDAKEIKKPSNWNSGKGYKDVVKDPYKTGRTGNIPRMSRDHLEVFIPEKVKESK